MVCGVVAGDQPFGGVVTRCRRGPVHGQPQVRDCFDCPTPRCSRQDETPGGQADARVASGAAVGPQTTPTQGGSWWFRPLQSVIT